MAGADLIIIILVTSFIGYFCLGVGGNINPTTKPPKGPNEDLGDAIAKAVDLLKKEVQKESKK